MPRKPVLAGLALIWLLALPGCWVWVDSNPRDVDAAFREALVEVNRIQAVPAAERGRPHKVRLLVYDEGDNQLVKLSVPLWLVRKVAEHAADDGDADVEQARELDRFGLTLDQVLEGGRGMLLQADEEDERVLIWLE